MKIQFSGADLLQAAKSAYESGNAEQGERIYRVMLDQMKKFCAAGEAQYAVGCETLVYRILVKFRETEESCERYFSDWRDDFYQLGLKYRDESIFSDGSGVGFVMQTLFSLGHTQALYNTLRIGGGRNIYVIGNYNEESKRSFEAIGCKVTTAIDAAGLNGIKSTIVERIAWIRSRMAQDGIGLSIWTATPSVFAFAAGMGMSRKQGMWSHRHHPYLPGADLYLCYGKSGVKRDYHGHEWTCVRPPMVDWDAVRGNEVKNGRQFSFGTIAREEKMEVPEFLEAVIEILAKVNGATYDFCGKSLPPLVQRKLEDARVWDRCHFSGWVEPVSHVGKYGVFLETFPSGGICSLYACARDVPVIALRSNTNPLTHMGYHVSESVEEYISDAITSVNHPNELIERGRRVIEREKEQEREDVKYIYSVMEGAL